MKFLRTRQNKKKQPKLISKYRSGFEKTVCDDLEKREVPFVYEGTLVPYVIHHRYKPDLILNNGIIIEMKGWFKADDRTKHLAIKEQHPELDIRFVLQDPNITLSKKSKTTYAMWCEKYGFKWAALRVPEEWINENL